MMKSWLFRGGVIAVARGARGAWFANWSRWLQPSGPVPNHRFQDIDDPFPRHWRLSPEQWPAEASPLVLRKLPAALDGLPPTWRAVVVRHDILGQADDEIAHSLGLTMTQSRAMLARARAALCHDLDRQIHRTTE